jgi:hypothetical protein
MSALALFSCAVALCPRPAAGQIVPGITGFGSDVAGVAISPEGHVRTREMDPKQDLAERRNRARDAGKAATDPTLVYVSLPRLFTEARACVESGKPIPDELLYLGGMTQLRYVFVYDGGERDLVIAGPGGPWRKRDALNVVNQRTGRPVLHLDDLVAAQRTSARPSGWGRGGGGDHTFGCAIDPDPDSVRKSADVMSRFASASRQQRMDEMAKALGPQKVRVFGTEPDTRLALVCVAADYELKRFALGLDRAPVAGVGHAVDDSRSAANKFWFEASYAPLRVSPNSDAYELRGPRLVVKAGQFSFDPRGATKQAQTFAKNFSAKIEPLAAAVPVIAELQNVADLSLLAALIRLDRLDRRTGWDSSWTLSDGEGGYPLTRLPVPRTADTLVSAVNGSIAAGGVVLRFRDVVDGDARDVDASDALAAPRQQVQTLRRSESSTGQTVLRAPLTLDITRFAPAGTAGLR